MGSVLSTIKLELDLIKTKNQFRLLKGRSIEEISTYASSLCKEIAKDIDFLETPKFLKLKITSLEDLYNFNNNDIANIAYIALNSPEPYCVYAKLRFEEIMTLIDKL